LLPEQVEIAALARRWRAIIIAIAFLLPIASVALEQATRAFPDSAFAIAYLGFLGVPRSGIVPFDGAGIVLGVTFSPVTALVFNWPLLVFAARDERHITRYWPHTRAATAAMTMSTIGLLVLYGIFFALLPSDSLLHAGAGVPFAAPFIWLLGWLFVLASQALGLAIIKFWPHAAL
jgi:hypothetical protein